MPLYHVNPDGNPGVCRAVQGKCPFQEADGTTTPHGEFASMAEARVFAEQVTKARFEDGVAWNAYASPGALFRGPQSVLPDEDSHFEEIFAQKMRESGFRLVRDLRARSRDRVLRVLHSSEKKDQALDGSYKKRKATGNERKMVDTLIKLNGTKAHIGLVKRDLTMFRTWVPTSQATPTDAQSAISGQR